ncbi:MAG: hypothetical protein GKS00_10865 [Alphaproteobacteria bacterium]|nr:hypothetical protein [Alphaproteobacteria bacterium]
MSEVLDVPISFFFDDMPEALAGSKNPDDVSEAPDLSAFNSEDARELVRAYFRIDDPRIRRRLFDLAKSLAQAEQAE